MRRLVPLLTVFLLLGGAGKAELPHHKPGLWAVTSRSSDGSVFQSKVCLDAMTETAYNVYNLTANAQHCSTSDVTQNGAETVVDGVCELSDSTVTSHSVITGTPDTAYHIESTAHWAPPMLGKTDTRSSQDAKWVGACPADMKAGDIDMPGVMKTSLGALAVGAQR